MEPKSENRTSAEKIKRAEQLVDYISEQNVEETLRSYFKKGTWIVVWPDGKYRHFETEEEAWTVVKEDRKETHCVFQL